MRATIAKNITEQVWAENHDAFEDLLQCVLEKIESAAMNGKWRTNVNFPTATRKTFIHVVLSDRLRELGYETGWDGASLEIRWLIK